MNFTSKKPAFEHLRKKWIAKHSSLQNKLLDKHGAQLRHFTVGSLGGLLLLAAPTTGFLPSPQLIADSGQVTKDTDKNAALADELSQKIPKEIRVLTPEEETDIGNILTKNFGFPVTAVLDGKRLNRSYGLIGGEQHLYRYPGDTLFKHAGNASDWAMYGSSGMAPGLGAWGYFVPSQAEFDETIKEREKYYIAVQTFLAPGFAENVKEYRDFFKFRKMLLVNPKTGQSVITDIGDAGPAAWTGKHLGGSPEVMHFLGLAEGPRKGPVLYFFIDDSNDTIPLGPIKVSEKIAKT